MSKMVKLPTAVVVSHAIQFDDIHPKSASVIHGICVDVDHWSSFMPAVVEATRISSSETIDEVRITAKVNKDIVTWISDRRIDSSSLTVTFQRRCLPQEASALKGQWHVIQEDSSCLLTLTHEFTSSFPSFSILTLQAIIANANADLIALHKHYYQVYHEASL